MSIKKIVNCGSCGCGVADGEDANVSEETAEEKVEEEKDAEKEDDELLEE